MERNRIPRNFNRIKAKILIETSASKPGDVFHFFKIIGGYLGLNTATGLYYQIFPSMIRDKSVSEIIEII